MKNIRNKQIKSNIVIQKEEVPISRTLTSIVTLKVLINPSTSLLLKDNNQESIILAYNPVFYIQTKHIDIQHHYIKRINLQFISTLMIIIDGLTKALT